MLGHTSEASLGSNVPTVQNSCHVIFETGLILQVLLDCGEDGCSVNDESGNHWRWMDRVSFGLEAAPQTRCNHF